MGSWAGWPRLVFRPTGGGRSGSQPIHGHAHDLCLFSIVPRLMVLRIRSVQLYAEPKLHHLAALADWKIGHLERVIDKLKPDVIHYHDDWGSKHNLFLAPEVWRAIIKPQHQRIVDLSSPGIIFMHHSTASANPSSRIWLRWESTFGKASFHKRYRRYQRKLDGRMALMEDRAQVIDHPHDEQVIRRSAPLHRYLLRKITLFPACLIFCHSSAS